MGCEQSTAKGPENEDNAFISQNGGVEVNSSRNFVPKNSVRRKGVGATEHLMNSGKIDPKLAPKLDEKGNLIEEEIIKRTKSSIRPKQIILGNGETGGARIRADYAYWTQRGYYPDDPSKENQDEYSIGTKFAGDNGDAMFGVYDGHGQEGHTTSSYAKEKLPNIIAKYIKQKRVKEYQKSLEAQGKATVAYNPSMWPKLNVVDYEAACRKGFLECNRAMNEELGRSANLSGTTAVTVSFHFGRMTICNVGDSRAVIGHRVSTYDYPIKEERAELASIGGTTQQRTRREGYFAAIPLTKDQTPYRSSERERVKKAGAVVMTVDQMEGKEPMHERWAGLTDDTVDTSGDPPRVFERGKEYPGCAFTRSLGDKVGEKCGVIPDPEMISIETSNDDKYLVIASDGVFEFLSNQNVIDMCSSANNPLEACEVIIRSSYKQWLMYENRTDDITAIVIFLHCEREQKNSACMTSEMLLGKENIHDFKPLRKK